MKKQFTKTNIPCSRYCIFSLHSRIAHVPGIPPSHLDVGVVAFGEHFQMENIRSVQSHTENHSFQVCRFLLYFYSIFLFHIGFSIDFFRPDVFVNFFLYSLLYLKYAMKGSYPWPHFQER